MALSKADINTLNWAIDEAETWRGSMIGNPDPVPLRQFDAKIRKARKALEAIKEMNHRLEGLEK